MKRFFAFTLAETLIVIGVIGIVSALTLPNLNSSTGDKERVAKVKKIYQNLQDAFGRAEAVYGPYSDWFVNDGNDMNAKVKRTGERISEFMKTSKDCGMGVLCSTQGYIKHLNGGEYRVNYSKYYRFITSDGSAFAINPNSIIVDIDGPTKGTYTSGKDVFYFDIIDNDGIFPNGYNQSISDLITNLASSSFCSTAWIINYDNADYLKLDRGKCQNGKAPTEDNPRCK